MHRYLFQDVYPWAGQLRTVDITKANGPFAHHAFIVSEGQRLGDEIAVEHQLIGLEKQRFVERLAYHWGEWNALHPFAREMAERCANGPASLRSRAGYDFQQHRIDPNRWNHASAASFHGDPLPMEELFANCIKPRTTR